MIQNNKNIYGYFEQNVVNYPGKVAIKCAEGQLTYAQLNDQILAFVTGLEESGLKEGDHVALVIGNGAEYAVALMACAFLGLVVLPMPLTFKPTQIQTSLTSTSTNFVIAWHTVCKKLLDQNVLKPSNCISVGAIEAHPELATYQTILSRSKRCRRKSNVNPESSYILTMTSGSTGDPKPILFSQQTKIMRAFEGTAKPYGLNDRDVILVSTPLYHSLAQRSLLLPLILGGTAIVLKKFSVQGWIDAIEKDRVSFLFAVSSQLDTLLDSALEEHDFSSLNTIVSSSAILSDASKQRLLALLSCDIRECYGASEIGVATELSITQDVKHLGSVGKPLPYVDIKICDQNRQVLGVGEVGEIACRSITAFLGYFGQSEKTRQAMDDEGYFYTGDLGCLDEDGYLFYRGRIKEVIITGGINVYPSDVEQVLREQEFVSEVAVVGLKDAKFGEIVVACIVPAKQNLDVREMELASRKVCLTNLADYQQPQKFVLMNEFPKSGLGKILKQKLKQQIVEETYNSAH